MTGQHRLRRVVVAGIGLSLGLTLAVGPGSTSAAAPQRWSRGVESWVTDLSTGQRLDRQPRTEWRRGGGDPGATIVVEPTRRYQSMTGFGASMTDSSAYVLTEKATARNRRAIMRELFSPTDGIGLSVLRQPMGASDFAVGSAYSYDDQPAGETDADLSDFSIAHDRAYILPRLREAYSHNPRLTFMASPWSAPGWMKDTGSMVTGSLLPRYHQAYAEYFVEFIEAYRRAGIPTDYVTMQNEPLYQPADYPGMWVLPDQAAQFIGRHLGPTLEREGLSRTKILGYDHNWEITDYPEAIYADRRAARYAPGTAWHCYQGKVLGQSVSHNNYPHAQAFQTECSGGEWQGTENDAFEQTMSSVIGVPRNWGQSVVLWNLALDERNGPYLGGCKVCRGVVTVNDNGTVTKELEYWALGHASKFVRPGAVRIGSSELDPDLTDANRTGVTNVAYQNRDGSTVLVAFNAATARRTFDVQVGNRHFSASLAPGAAATYLWTSPRRVRAAADLGWVDLDFGRGPAGTPGGRLVASVGSDERDALNQVKLGDSWLAYSLPYGAELERSGAATTLPRNDWELTAAGVPSAPEQNPLTNMTDGNPATRWTSGTAQSPAISLTLDLGSEQTFSEISLEARASLGDYLRRYTVQVSADKTTWTDVARGQGRAGETAIALPTTRTRYLRLVSEASAVSWWSIHELELRNAQLADVPVRPGRSLVRDTATLDDNLLVGYYNAGRRTADVPWPVRGFGYTYRLPATAAVTFAVLEE